MCRLLQVSTKKGTWRGFFLLCLEPGARCLFFRVLEKREQNGGGAAQESKKFHPGWKRFLSSKTELSDSEVDTSVFQNCINSHTSGGLPLTHSGNTIDL